MSELMTFLSNKKVVTNDMESATTTLAQRVGFEPTGARNARWISSPCRYDLFGTAAYKLSEIILYCFYYFVNIASDYIL